MSTRIRAAAERALSPGYSTCLRCDRPWKFVKGHTTSYSKTNGCFPLCEACWGDLGTPEARLPYYERLVVLWAEDATGFKNGERETYLRTLEDEKWPAIKAAVEAGR